MRAYILYFSACLCQVSDQKHLIVILNRTVSFLQEVATACSIGHMHATCLMEGPVK